MELGEIIRGLGDTDPDIPVIIGRFDVVCLDFVSLASYIQFYAQLAIATEKKMFTDEFKTVKEVLSHFKYAVNKRFVANDDYPYLMNIDTHVWVANKGEFGNIVNGLYDMGDRIEIRYD
jgi:hypothetical protein